MFSDESRFSMQSDSLRNLIWRAPEGLNIHQCAQKIRALQTVLEAKREEFMDDALICAKSLCEELEISFEPQDESGGIIHLATEVKMFSYRTKMT
ncbi:hypothetical protein TNCV_2099971 [Trichonephila clavipes]|nr:hypothetical protein TNCV_2099971 [Trichonephila clavipes]